MDGRVDGEQKGRVEVEECWRERWRGVDKAGRSNRGLQGIKRWEDRVI